MAQGASVWDQSELKGTFQTARDSIFGAAKEKEKEKETSQASEVCSLEEVDSDGDDAYEQ